MKHTLRVAIALLVALLSSSISHAQSSATDGLMDGFTMPMRITGSNANSSVDIGIDTIRYVRGGMNSGEVSLDAHANLQIPFAIEDGQESTVIKFRGKNIILSGSGEPSVLEADIPLDPIVIHEDKIWLDLEEGRITFTCDGVQSIGLRGAFIFSQSFIAAADNSTDNVRAEFDIEVADWDDLVFAVTFDKPFTVKGSGGFVFEVTEAVVDFSTLSNVPGFTFPLGYDTGFLNSDKDLWTGFALKSLSVTPPAEINEMDGEESEDRSFKFSVSNMLIDESGLTGSFTASRPSRSDENQTSGLNVSIDSIGVSIVQSYLVGGLIAGDATVPLLKDQKTDAPLQLSLEGQLQYDRLADKLRYRLSAEMLDERTFGVPFAENNASITLAKGCSFTVGNENSLNKFGAALLLNGMLNIKEGVSGLNFEGIRFEGLRLSTIKDPAYFDWKHFGLVGTVGMNYGGFSIHLNELGLTKESDEKAFLNANVMLALMDGQFSIAAATGFTISARYEPNRWLYQGFNVDAISLDADFSAFRFTGVINLYDEDPMYGNGFRGDIKLTLKKLGLGLGATLQFGNTNYESDHYYKYWYADIEADIPKGIILFPPAVMLNSIKGGAYQRMNNDLDKNSLATPQTLAYTPNESTAFGFLAGVGLYFAQPKLLSADVLLEMAFNTHFGLKYVKLEGAASVLSDDPSTPGKGLVNADLLSYYDVENKEFSTELNVDVNFVDVITGKGNVSIYSSPDTWHCYVGTIDVPNELSFIGLAHVKSYFMLGAIPSQLPPLNPRVLSLFGPQAYSNAGGQEAATLMGKGFAFGISLSADCGFGKKRGFVFAFIEVEGGSDALVDFNDRPCGKYEVDWRGYGRAYAYVNAEAGIRVRKKKFKILQLAGATALNAEFPQPYYLSGNIAFKFKVLFIKGKISAGYSAGRRC